MTIQSFLKPHNCGRARRWPIVRNRSASSDVHNHLHYEILEDRRLLSSGDFLQTINNPTPAAGDFFGDSVAISGSTVAVGASDNDTGATDAGSVYLFGAASGNLLRTINNPAPEAGDWFGLSVAISASIVKLLKKYCCAMDPLGTDANNTFDHRGSSRSDVGGEGGWVDVSRMGLPTCIGVR
jgi:hypothetical protein